MTHVEFCQALTKLRPREAWSAPTNCMSVDDPRFQWLAGTAKPTQAQVAAVDISPEPPKDLLDWFNDLSPARKGLFKDEMKKP